MKYVPNGRPLTAHERELLVCLVEECAEVSHAACKLLRFGVENRPDKGEPNTAVLARELGDLQAVKALVIARTVVSQEAVWAAEHAKLEKLAYYLQTDEGEE